MIELRGENGSLAVLISNREIEILDADQDHILARCSLSDLAHEQSQHLPNGLALEIHSEDGFGTFFFHELELSEASDGMTMAFRCHTPNKYWEGKFGLATFLIAIREQVGHQDNWKITQIELDDDWKGITLERNVALGDPIVASIHAAASALKVIFHAAEVALSGLPWSDEYAEKEDSFCRELLQPLLRRMGFLFVRYAHGKRECGKDFTFSELTPFGHHRHYGLQAKAGDVSGGVKSFVDELLGTDRRRVCDALLRVGFEGPQVHLDLHYCN